MNIFQRMTATLHSRIEHTVSHMEDHDAVIEATLKDTRSAIAKARVRLARVQKDNVALRSKLAMLQESETLWASRAKQIAASDEAKALQCVERRNQCQAQISQTQEALERHEKLEQTIGDTVVRMEKRQEELSQQRNLMRSRHSAADAMRIIRSIEAQNPAHGLDDAFERWEARILEAEYECGDYASTSIDTLDAAFTAEEDTRQLKADLDNLLQEPNSRKEE